MESLPLAVLMVDADGAVVLANRALERLFGYSKVELIGQSVDVLVPDGVRFAHAGLRYGYVQQPAARPMGFGRELFGRRKDGSEVAVAVELAPVRFGAASFVVASVVDITEQRRIQTELRSSREEQAQFETLVSELGAEFVGVRPDDVDRSITEALGRVVRALDLDRSALFQLVEDSGDFVHTHQWTRPGWPTPPARVSATEQFPWHLLQVRAGELVSFTTLDEVPDPIDRENLRRLATKSSVTVPLAAEGRTWGAVSFGSARAPRTWTPEVINRLRVVALMFANVLMRKHGDETLRRTLAEGVVQRDRLRDENVYLRQELKILTGAPAIVGHSPAIRRVMEQIRQVARTETTVLLQGETGTGKTLLASRIHELSARGDRALVRVNCAALSSAWLEDELFGKENGSSMEADSRHIGRLELANRSTVFFDEIADLPLEAQASLARVLQDKQIQPPGSFRPVKVDVRVIAATRRDLLSCIAEGTFRDDLYYRLDVFPIQVPALRDRTEDIPLLVWRFVDEFSELYGKPIDAIDQESMALLQQYSWPGNARELRNVVERAIIVASGRQLRIPLPSGDSLPRRGNETLAAVEKEHITAVLSASGGRIDGKGGAADRLGVTPRALEAMITKLGISINGPGA
jgi:PAS domain S-box-containing protein